LVLFGSFSSKKVAGFRCSWRKTRGGSTRQERDEDKKSLAFVPWQVKKNGIGYV